MIEKKIVGAMVAVATPFNEDYSIDYSSFENNIKFMTSRGLTEGNSTLLIGGAGGEHPVLNVEERVKLMEVAVQAAANKVPVLTSIQHTDWREIIKMAKSAEDIGIFGCQLGPTYYYMPTKHDVLDLFTRVADSSNVNLMIYHTWWDGFVMDFELLDQLIEIPNVNSIKWSHGSIDKFREGLTRYSKKVAMIDNSGNHILSNIYGASGFITHLSSFWPEYPRSIWDALQSKDYEKARDLLLGFKSEWMEWVKKVVQETGGEGPFIKVAMELVGLKAGPPRPPSKVPSDNLIKELDKLLLKYKVPRNS
ncbi:MAG: dihydrodipicolinate synthase family protein [Dehalococcoidia bacterium]|tara:strand:+ start:540 stop:1460 length:921 start_codon:yes stop_codon:yes gene_type:complete